MNCESAIVARKMEGPYVSPCHFCPRPFSLPPCSLLVFVFMEKLLFLLICFLFCDMSALRSRRRTRQLHEMLCMEENEGWSLSVLRRLYLSPPPLPLHPLIDDMSLFALIFYRLLSLFLCLKAEFDDSQRTLSFPAPPYPSSPSSSPSSSFLRFLATIVFPFLCLSYDFLYR